MSRRVRSPRSAARSLAREEDGAGRPRRASSADVTRLFRARESIPGLRDLAPRRRDRDETPLDSM